jgi:hypothetical protein
MDVWDYLNEVYASTPESRRRIDDARDNPDRYPNYAENLLHEIWSWFE